MEVTARRVCRHLVLRWLPDTRRLTLSVPTGTSAAEARRFLAAQETWIRRRVGEPSAWEPAWLPGERHLVLGRRVVLGEEGVPCGEKAFLAYRAEMLTALVRALLPLWESRLGVRAAGLRYRDMRSRWGSCQTVTGRITLNLRLGAYPEECVTYVLAHELCHLRHADHSPAFHEELQRVLPECTELKRRLNALDARPLPPA